MMQRRALWSGDIDMWGQAAKSVLERDSSWDVSLRGLARRRKHRKRLYDMFRYPVSLAGYKRYPALGLNTCDDYCLHFNKIKLHVLDND